jgi:hypothetical protein
MVGDVFGAGTSRVSFGQQQAGVMEIRSKQAFQEHLRRNGDSAAVESVEKADRCQYDHLAMAQVVIREAVSLKIRVRTGKEGGKIVVGFPDQIEIYRGTDAFGKKEYLVEWGAVERSRKDVREIFVIHALR